jgi:hypothetical protein
VMTHQEKPKSLLITLYNQHRQALFKAALPLSVAAPAINRILREALGDKMETLKEPWYLLIAHRPGRSGVFQRSSVPAGECSLYGERYVPANEPPPRVTHHPQPQVEFFTVLITDFQDEIFRGQFSVDDLFLAGAEFLTRRLMEKGKLHPEDEPLYYDVDLCTERVLSVQPDLFPDDAWKVEGVFRLPPREPARPRIAFTKVASSPLPVASKSKFGRTELRGRGKKGRGTVLMHPRVYRDLLEITLSDQVENGGYLMGIPYRNVRSPHGEDDPKFHWTVEITDLIQAHDAIGRPALLLFNGDCWSQMRRTAARDYPDKKLVSWFHTHLFAASDDFGLSGLDQDLHRQFFSRPWQVAVLINIDSQNQREVRCFQRGPEGDLVECQFEVLEEE